MVHQRQKRRRFSSLARGVEDEVAPLLDELQHRFFVDPIQRRECVVNIGLVGAGDVKILHATTVITPRRKSLIRFCYSIRL